MMKLHSLEGMDERVEEGAGIGNGGFIWLVLVRLIFLQRFLFPVR